MCWGQIQGGQNWDLFRNVQVIENYDELGCVDEFGATGKDLNGFDMLACLCVFQRILQIPNGFIGGVRVFL